MAALSKAFETYERPGLVVAYPVGATQIHKGSLVGLDASGHLRPLDDSVSLLRFVGVANESLDHRDGVAGDRTLNVTKAGSFSFKAEEGTAHDQSHLGLVAYAVTDWEVTRNDSPLAQEYAVGTIVAIETTSTGHAGVRVRIDNHTV